MNKIKFFWVNPYDVLIGRARFPLGYFTFPGCQCKTCIAANGGKPGWGMVFLIFGFNVTHQPVTESTNKEE